MHRTKFDTIELAQRESCILAGILSILVVCFVPVCQGQSYFLDGFAARVNGTVIFQSDIAAERAIIRVLTGLDSHEPSPVTDTDILEELINRELLLQQAHRFLNQTITQEEIDKHQEEIDRQFGSREKRQQFMSKNNISEVFWRTRIRHLVLLRQYMEQRVMAFVRVSKKDEDEYILSHSQELGIPENDSVSELVPDEHPLRKAVNQLLELQAAERKKQSLILDLRSSAEIEYTNGKMMSGVTHESVQPEEN